MRLTCPRCSAQYEIADAAIPLAGREVECSACSHVWHQPRQAGATEPAAAYDPTARPELNRPLNESILSILREETARELKARQTGPAEAEGAPDHIPANSDQDAPGDQPKDQPPEAPEDAEDTDNNWPATTVTEAMPVGQNDVPPADPRPTADHKAPAPEKPKRKKAAAFDPGPRTGPAPHATDTPNGLSTEPVAPALPDAEELAATLTRPGPLPPQDSGTAPSETKPEGTAANADTPDDNPTGKAGDAPVPVPVPAATASGYASGFGLAVMITLGILALYALAPRVSADEDGGVLAGFRQEIDRGRLWLHDRIIGGE